MNQRNDRDIFAMKSLFIAYVCKRNEVQQSVVARLIETAIIFKRLVLKLNLSLTGELFGLMHDFSKYSSTFQKYIYDATATGSVNPDDETDISGNSKADHSALSDKATNHKIKEFYLGCFSHFLHGHSINAVRIIMNSKKWGQGPYQYRKAVFGDIKGRLKNKEYVIFIGTRLIRAGVDVSKGWMNRVLGRSVSGNRALQP